MYLVKECLILFAISREGLSINPSDCCEKRSSDSWYRLVRHNVCPTIFVVVSPQPFQELISGVFRGGGHCAMAPPFGCRKFFLKGLKRDGEADGPPLHADLGYLGRRLEENWRKWLKKKKKRSSKKKGRQMSASQKKVVNFLWPWKWTLPPPPPFVNF
jgi:hypothetical protein